MQIILTILLILLAVIALVFIAAAFGKDETHIVAETVINKPRQSVYDYMKFLKNSDHFNKWVMMDPVMKKDYKGTDGTTGFIYAWDSAMKQVGQGEQEITALKEAEQIDYEIRFKKPFEGTSTARFVLSPVADTQTRVQWTFNSKNTYMTKVFNLIFSLEKKLAKDLRSSLATLKNILEK